MNNVILEEALVNNNLEPEELEEKAFEQTAFNPWDSRSS